MIIGIDASNIRTGGGKKHLINFINSSLDNNLISEIIDNPDIGIRISRSAVKSIRTKFNWDNTINEYQKLYNLG